MKHVHSWSAIAERAALIMPTRNRPELLGETLDRLLDAGIGVMPLYVYDDASDQPQRIRETVLKRFPSARIIRGERKAGQAYGRNVLLRTMDREFAVCLDDDVYFLDAGRLQEWVMAERDASPPAIVAFRCRDRQDVREVIADSGLSRPERCAGFVAGWCLFHVPTILSVGGYRDFWGYGFEEPELALRLVGEGHTIVYDPSIYVEHNHRIDAVARRDNAEYARMYARNSILMFSLNTLLVWGLPRGMARSIRYLGSLRHDRVSGIVGFAMGICDTFRYYRFRHPLPVATVRRWEDACRQGSKPR